MSATDGDGKATRPLPELVSERLVMGLGDEGDGALIAALHRDNLEHFAQFETASAPPLLTDEHWQQEIRRHRAEFAGDTSCRFLVFDRQDPAVLIGLVSIFNIMRGTFHSAILGYRIDAGSGGQGLMSEAVSLGIGYGFSELNLHRLGANYHPDNVRSGRLLERLGFVREGYAKDYLRLRGGWCDHVLTALTNEAWVPDDLG